MTFVRGHFQATPSGFAYVTPSARSSGRGLAVSAVTLALLLIGLIATTSRLARSGLSPWTLATMIVLIGSGAAVTVILRRRLTQYQTEQYLALAAEVARGADIHRDELRRLAQAIPRDDQRRAIGEEEVYGTLIAEILADAEVTDAECERIEYIGELFAFDPSRAMAIREAAFDGFVSWVGVDLTRQQEAALSLVAMRLGISQDHAERALSLVSERRTEREQRAALAAELERQAALAAERERQAALEAERARRAALAAEREKQAALEAERLRQEALAAKRARQEALAAERAERERQNAQRKAAQAVFTSPDRVAVDVGVKLKRGESCWWSSAAVLRDRKKESTGTCYVSNNRLFFVADKLVSINMSRILDAAAEVETGILRVIKDGRKSPYEFFLDQPLVALAHIERSLDESNARG